MGWRFVAGMGAVEISVLWKSKEKFQECLHFVLDKFFALGKDERVFDGLSRLT